VDDADYAILASEWDDMSAEDKLEALDRVVNDFLEDWGYPPVDVVGAELDDALGEYDDARDEITFDLDSTLGEDSFSEALDTAFHEAAHALNDATDEVEFGDTDSDDYNAIDPETGEPVDPGHQDVYDFAATQVAAVSAGVGLVMPFAPPPPAAAESGGDGGIDGGDVTFEPDFGAATVEGDGYGGFEMGEATVSP
jgi:hypothetical protein